jgi:hypothetical protein
MLKILKKINIWNRYFPKKEQIFLFLLIFIGFFVRLITAVKTQLWRDEIYVFLTSQQNSLLNLLLQKHWDTAHPPLYFIFLHFWGKIFYTPFLLRLPSLIISFLILYFLPILAKEIDKKSKIFPYVILFFFSFSHFQVSLNIVARPYPPTIFFGLISLILFIKIINNVNVSWKIYFFWGFFSSLMITFDYSGFWFLGGEFFSFLIIFLLLRKKIKEKVVSKIFLGFIPILLTLSLILPLVLINLKQSFHLERFLADNFINDPASHIKDSFMDLFGITYKDIFLTRGLMNNNQLLFFYLLINFFGFLFLFFENKITSFCLLLIEILIIFLNLGFSFLIYPVFLARHVNFFNLLFLTFFSYFFSFILRKKFINLFIISFLGFYLINFFNAFPRIHYVDPPYDFLKLHKTIYSYPEKNKKIIFTHAPLFMFAHLSYYRLFWPTRNVKILNSNFEKNLEDKKDKNIFYLDFLYEKDEGNQYLPQNFDIKNNLNCSYLKRIYIDYIYLVECL